jgi:hypothetical protein
LSCFSLLKLNPPPSFVLIFVTLRNL